MGTLGHPVTRSFLDVASEQGHLDYGYDEKSFPLRT